MRYDLAHIERGIRRYLTRYPFALAVLQQLKGYSLQVIALEYPVDVKRPRYGYAKPPHEGLSVLLRSNRHRIERNLSSFAQLRPYFELIPRENPAGSMPFWDSGWLGPLDGVALYGFLAAKNPRRYVEIGSGNSTKFARRAIGDQNLRTQITSIDPHPRAEINKLCDVSMRVPFEKVDLAVFESLERDDIVFFDGSHRCFTNSDVTVFFLELLPALRPGVLVHIHDIFLPFDYPPNTPYYSEQYVLAAYLLGGAQVDVEMANAYVGSEPDLLEAAHKCLPTFQAEVLRAGSSSFWFTKSG